MSFEFTPGAHHLQPSTAPGRITTWSYSSLSKFEQCPYAVYLSKIEGIKEPAGPAADRGSAIHKVWEDYIQGNTTKLVDAGKKPNIELADTLREAYANGEVEIEEEWTVDRNWDPVPPKTPEVWGICKLDVFRRDSPTSAQIIDHKSGTSWGKAVKHGDQGMVYAVNAFMRYPDLGLVSTQFNYVDEGVLSQPTYWRRHEIDLFRMRLDKRAHRLTSATDFPPAPSKHNCKWCRYKDEVRREDGAPACKWGVLA